MNTALPCRGRRALVFLAVALVLGWAAASSRAAIPPMFSFQKVINNTPPDDLDFSGPRLTPAVMPPPEETIPSVEVLPPILEPPVVVQPPPVSPPLLPGDVPTPQPPAETPEPTTLVMGLLGSGIAGVLVLRRRRSQGGHD
jgi:hypothetical protein